MAQQQQYDPNDPFASMGGGVQINGGWVPRSHPLAQSQAGAQAVQAAAAPGAVGGTPQPAATPQSIQGAYQQSLQNLITGPTPQQAGANAAQAAPAQAYNAAVKAQEPRDRQFLAERAAAGGFSGSGGFETGVMGLRQKTNQDIGRYAGETAGAAEQGRRQELLQSLALAQQFGNDQAVQQLQRELGMGNLDVNRNQLGLQAADREAYWNYLTLQQLLGGGLSL